MNGLIALSLSLVLGQTPSSTPSTDDTGFPSGSDASQTATAPSDDVGFGGSGSEQDTSAQGQAAAAQQGQDLEQLQAQLQSLQAQLQAQQQQTQQVQGQLAEMQQQQALAQQQQEARQATSERLEQLRVERLDNLERGYQWLALASQQLFVGERAVGPELDSAQREMTAALTSATQTGHSEAASLIQSALNRMVSVNDSIEQRNLYLAQRQLQDAGSELRSAWEMSTNRPSATLVNP